MPAAKTTAKPTDEREPPVEDNRLGLSDEERLKLLGELADDRPLATIEARELTPRERVIASLLPERAHLEGCPVIDAPASAVALVVEASDSISPAPGQALKRLGVRPGDYCTTVRCIQCGGSKHLAGTVREVLLARLTLEPVLGELDGTIE